MMTTPTRRHDASDLAFLVSGMDRACGCPWHRGELHEMDPDGLIEPVEGDPDAWRVGAYTTMLMMDCESHSLLN